MSRKLKKTLAMILSLVTVFSASFTSLAEIPAGVEEPVEVAEIGGDQAVIPEEPASVIADVLDDAAIPDAEVDSVLEVEEVVEDDSSETEEVFVGKMGENLFGAGEVFKAVYNKTNTTLTFYYDAVDHSGTDIEVYSPLPTEASVKSSWPYDEIRKTVTEVVIDDSVAGYDGLKSTSYMFQLFNSLKKIEGLNNLNVSNVTNMKAMFANCILLENIDLGAFDTASVTDMGAMFYGCGNLVTVFVSEGFDTKKVTSSSNMFINCTKLEGGAGTKYEESKIDATYAHIDGGTTNPGYFTRAILTWDQLQAAITAAGTTPTTITLTQDVFTDQDYPGLKIDNNQNITLILNGHNIIKDSKGTYGGNCITVNKDATLTVKDESTVTHNFKVGDDGLWVLDPSGDKTLTGGCIMGLNPDPGNIDGIGVFINGGGTLNLYGGNIVGNKARKNSEGNGGGGGGVVVCGSATLNMYGGSITGNTAEKNGGGVYVDGVLNVYGGSITGNTLAGGTTANNVYLPDGKYITIGADCSAADFGVTTEKAPTEGTPVKITTNGTAADVDYFTSDNPDYIVAYNATGYLELQKPAVISAWADLQAAITAAGTTPTTITLTQDVIAKPTDSRLVIDDDQTITLDLNGYNIIKDSKDSESGGNCITVNDRAVLTIKDESTETHNFKVVDGLWVLDDAGDKTLTGGCIMGINPKESDYDGIGVFINSNGTLNLRGGNIVGNKAGRWGGGVNVCGNAVFNIYGGSVIGNTAGDNGGGVCVDGELNVYGGNITENTLTDGTTENNVYLKNGKYILIGDNCSSEAKVGVTTEKAPTEGAPVKITTNGTAANVDYFTSDNPDYIVAYNATGYLELQKPAQKTIADILPANFPTKTEDGWVNENGCRICKHKFGELDGLLLYILEAGKYIPGTFFEGSSVLTGSGNNYVYYEEANGRITFCMNGDVIESIKIEDVPTGCPEIANGIYKFVAPIPTPTPVEKESEEREPLFTGTWNNPVKNGSWSQDAHGIWHYASSETFKNTWAYIYNPYAHDGQNTSDWFWFDRQGNMLTGWQFINGKWYYLNPSKDGTLGACQLGGVTPDGHTVDENGAWDGNGTEPIAAAKTDTVPGAASAPYTGTWNAPVQNGAWSLDANGIWHYTTTQQFKNTWAYIYNPYAHDGQHTSDWFWFDEKGNMLTGWQRIGGKWYYLHPNKDGVLGSCLIGPATTPDGYKVDETGARID